MVYPWCSLQLSFGEFLSAEALESETFNAEALGRPDLNAETQRTQRDAEEDSIKGRFWFVAEKLEREAIMLGG